MRLSGVQSKCSKHIYIYKRVQHTRPVVVQFDILINPNRAQNKKSFDEGRVIYLAYVCG